jgi:hypothetical protein
MIYRDQLEAVRKLIERPEAWIARKGFKDGDAYCMVGAWRMVCRGHVYVDSGVPGQSWAEVHDKDIAFAKALGLRDEQHVFARNDNGTHSEVLALLDAAIERAPVRT